MKTVTLFSGLILVFVLLIPGGVPETIAQEQSSHGIDYSDAPVMPGTPAFNDDFDDPTLDPAWSWIRQDSTHWSLTTRPGFLRIVTQQGDVYESTNNLRNLLIQQAPDGDFTITTLLTIEPFTHAQQGGLLVYQDDDNYIRITRGYMFTSHYVEFILEQNGSPTTQQLTVPDTTVYLAITRSGTHYTGYYSLDGTTWTPVGQFSNVSFHPSQVGIGAWNGDLSAPEIPVDFDFFHLTSGTGPAPSTKRPVILIPGMPASANWPCFLFEVGCDNPDDWDWILPTAEEDFQPLIERFADADYTEENQYLSVLFYDWRKPLADNIAVLKNRIGDVTTTTGSSAVDLVGHSMGGLLGRSYIQSDTYGDDVTHLVTLGSPHQGAAKAYPYWEAASFYRVDLEEKIAFSVILLYYMDREWSLNPIYTLRQVIPSFQDILPTADYVYDENNSDRVKPESEMIHRNTYLAGLNTSVATLLARTDVSTFAGQDLDTPVRFYVHDRSWWPWPRWDDGEPNWNREAEFMSSHGDETVSAASAQLPPPALTQEFEGVRHGELPGDDEVGEAIFDTLGIPIPSISRIPSTADQQDGQVLVLTLYGAADITVTDSLGNSVGPSRTTIPGAEYVSDPSDPFKLVLIPGPEDGSYDIGVQGSGSGTYALSLLDTFTPPPALITDTAALWDTAQSQIESSTWVTFGLTYTQATSPTTTLIAITPVVEVPVRVGSAVVTGRAMPGSNVEIRDADTDSLLGSGPTDTDGHFAITLTSSLGFSQRIYPWSNGVAGVPVTAEAYTIYLPLILRNS